MPNSQGTTFEFSGNKVRRMTKQKGKRTRQKKLGKEIGNGNQMTALRFQTGGRHQISPASLRGRYNDTVMTHNTNYRRATGHNVIMIKMKTTQITAYQWNITI